MSARDRRRQHLGGVPARPQDRPDDRYGPVSGTDTSQQHPSADTAEAAEPWWSGLRAAWSLDFRLAERVLTALGDGPSSLSALVAASGVDRRMVQQVLEALGNQVVADRSGRLALQGDVDVPPTGVCRRDSLRDQLAVVRSWLPPDQADLDHVSATVDTMARRAEFFADQYDLVGRTVLCVGDHDLTSVALTLLEPTCRALVVDIDPSVLAVLARARDTFGLDITLARADLRLGLPHRCAAAADLAFTDPPYSPEGMSLFVARCLDGLAETGHERVAFAYGFARSQVVRGFQTQDALHQLKLAYEAVLPGFNRFDGAEALGSASQLYVCRPTRWSRPAARATIGAEARIYTRGSAAEEAAAPELAVGLAQTAVGRATSTTRQVLVGDGWPEAVRSGTSQAGLDRYLSEPTGSDRQRRSRDSAVVNLVPYFGLSLPAVLLAGLEWSDLTVVVDPAQRAELEAGRALPQLLSGVAELTTSQTDGALVVRLTATTTEEDDPGRQLLQKIVRRPHATLRNVWREGLVAAAAQRGRTLTKREATRRIEAELGHAGPLSLRLVDLPDHDLHQLLVAVPRSWRSLVEAGVEE